MLILTITLLGLLTIGMAVHGGVLTSNEPRHRRAFVVYGFLGLILVGAQTYFLYRDDTSKSHAESSLRDAVGNLQEQTHTLMNAIQLQATLNDFKHLESVINAGLLHLEDMSKRGKASPRPTPTVPEVSSLGPAVVGNVRIVQRRAASSDTNASFGLQVVMQTTSLIQPVGFRLDFDQEISDGASVFIVGEGIYMMKATQISLDRKSFSFSFHSPAFTPNSSLVVSVQSKFDVRLVKATQIQPMF